MFLVDRLNINLIEFKELERSGYGGVFKKEKKLWNLRGKKGCLG